MPSIIIKSYESKHTIELDLDQIDTVYQLYLAVREQAGMLAFDKRVPMGLIFEGAFIIDDAGNFAALKRADVGSMVWLAQGEAGQVADNKHLRSLHQQCLLFERGLEGEWSVLRVVQSPGRDALVRLRDFCGARRTQAKMFKQMTLHLDRALLVEEVDVLATLKEVGAICLAAEGGLRRFKRGVGGVFKRDHASGEVMSSKQKSEFRLAIKCIVDASSPDSAIRELNRFLARYEQPPTPEAHERARGRSYGGGSGGSSGT